MRRQNLLKDAHDRSHGKIPFIVAVATTKGLKDEIDENETLDRVYFQASALIRLFKDVIANKQNNIYSLEELP